MLWFHSINLAFGKVTRSDFSLGHWSFFQIPRSNIPNVHMDRAVAVPINKFLWIIGGIRSQMNEDDGFGSM